MAKEKPWPDGPQILRERAIIQRGLQFYFTCQVCAELGWDKDCKNKAACGQYLYKRLSEHCRKWECGSETGNSGRISRN